MPDVDIPALTDAQILKLRLLRKPKPPVETLANATTAVRLPYEQLCKAIPNCRWFQRAGPPFFSGVPVTYLKDLAASATLTFPYGHDDLLTDPEALVQLPSDRYSWTAIVQLHVSGRYKNKQYESELTLYKKQLQKYHVKKTICDHYEPRRKQLIQTMRLEELEKNIAYARTEAARLKKALKVGSNGDI